MYINRDRLDQPLYMYPVEQCRCRCTNTSMAERIGSPSFISRNAPRINVRGGISSPYPAHEEGVKAYSRCIPSLLIAHSPRPRDECPTYETPSTFPSLAPEPDTPAWHANVPRRLRPQLCLYVDVYVYVQTACSSSTIASNLHRPPRAVHA